MGGKLSLNLNKHTYDLDKNTILLYCIPFIKILLLLVIDTNTYNVAKRIVFRFQMSTVRGCCHADLFSMCKTLSVRLSAFGSVVIYTILYTYGNYYRSLYIMYAALAISKDLYVLFSVFT